jgi:hypothetical protein
LGTENSAAKFLSLIENAGDIVKDTATIAANKIPNDIVLFTNFFSKPRQINLCKNNHMI